MWQAPSFRPETIHDTLPVDSPYLRGDPNSDSGQPTFSDGVLGAHKFSQIPSEVIGTKECRSRNSRLPTLLLRGMMTDCATSSTRHNILTDISAVGCSNHSRPDRAAFGRTETPEIL